MAYLALYRAWRPQRFADVVGQQHVTRTLQNAIRGNRLSHAYLFSGPRGTGKTSMAKILARAVNCEQGPAPEPCNVCEACRSITEGRQLDVVEIDAASNRGVDEIRDLRDKVKYASASVRYKVYIIDEVHMLTTEAFNALLKTLEEPPPHVLFIMATTEPHKIPLTILSRCQRFDFHRISVEAIITRLKEVAKSQGAKVHPQALAVIARLSEGGMRDALSLLDQVISFTEGDVTVEEVLSITGGLSPEALAGLWQSLLHGKTQEALQEVERWLKEGKEPAKIVESLFDYARTMMLVKAAPQLEESLDALNWDPALDSLQKEVHPETLVAQMEVLQHALQEMKWTTQARTLLELTMFKLSQPELIRAAASLGKGGSAGAPAVHTLKQQSGQAEQSGTSLRRGENQRGLQEDFQKGLQKVLTEVRSLRQRVDELERQHTDEEVGPTTAGSSAKDSAVSTSAPSSETRLHDKPRILQENVADRPEKANRAKQASLTSAQKVWENRSSRWTEQVQVQWDEVLQQVRGKKITVHAWLVAGDVAAATEDAVLVSFKTEIHRQTTEKAENRRLIEETITEVLGRPLRLVTVMQQELEAFAQADRQGSLVEIGYGENGQEDGHHSGLHHNPGILRASSEQQSEQQEKWFGSGSDLNRDTRGLSQGERVAAEEEHVRKALEWFGDIVEVKE